MPKIYAKEKVLSRFHFIVFNEVEKVWEILYQDIQIEVTRDRMMKQFTNDKIFHEMYVSHFAVTDTRASISADGSPTLTDDWSLLLDKTTICFLLGKSTKYNIRNYYNQWERFSLLANQVFICW